jgi:hypothetical protein
MSCSCYCRFSQFRPDDAFNYQLVLSEVSVVGIQGISQINKSGATARNLCCFQGWRLVCLPYVTTGQPKDASVDVHVGECCILVPLVLNQLKLHPRGCSTTLMRRAYRRYAAEAAYLACYSALVLLSALVLSQCSSLCSCVPVGHYKWFLVQCNELSLSLFLLSRW